MKKYIGWAILCLVFLSGIAAMSYVMGIMEAIILFITSIIIASIIIFAIYLISES